MNIYASSETASKNWDVGRFQHEFVKSASMSTSERAAHDDETGDFGDVGAIRELSPYELADLTESTRADRLLVKRLNFRTLQKWDGFVISVDSEVFTARLIPTVGEEGDQLAEIYLDELDHEDRQLLEPGTEFYWSIGYLDGPTGRRRVSSIRVRRLPVWSEGEIEEASFKSEQLDYIFENEPVNDSSRQ